MALHPKARGVGVYLERKICGRILPARCVSSPQDELVAPRLSGHSNRGTSFCVREDGEERTRWFRSTARRGTRRRSFKAKVPLRTRLISHGHASHIADETRWTQTWHDHTFVGTNVPDRAARTIGRPHLRLIRALRTQREVAIPLSTTVCPSRALLLRRQVVNRTVVAHRAWTRVVKHRV